MLQTQVSGTQRQLAETLGQMQIAHELEHVTEQGDVSIDIALPEHRMAIEVRAAGCSAMLAAGAAVSRECRRWMARGTLP